MTINRGLSFQDGYISKLELKFYPKYDDYMRLSGLKFDKEYLGDYKILVDDNSDYKTIEDNLCQYKNKPTCQQFLNDVYVAIADFRSAKFLCLFNSLPGDLQDKYINMMNSVRCTDVNSEHVSDIQINKINDPDLRKLLTIIDIDGDKWVSLTEEFTVFPPGV